MKKKIAVLPGDGVGPEVTAEAVKVLKKIAEIYKHEFEFNYGLIGAAAIDKTGDPYPAETHELCLSSDAILLGAIGDPKYDNDPSAKVRPEQGLLKMRKDLGLYINLRPIVTFESLYDKSPLKNDRVHGVDFVFVRELTGGIYFGKRERTAQNAYDTMSYSRSEIERITKFAYGLAKKRRRRLTLVDKANVLDTSRLWREVVGEISKQHTDVETQYMFVDNAAQQIIKRPGEFDVVLTENMFGDILSDEAAVIVGSLGMLPSASIGEKTALYEPIHGSFPKAAGQNIVNPIATILSAAMMLEYSFGLKKESGAIWSTVIKILNDGLGTKDIFPENPRSTSEVGDAIVNALT